MKFSLGLAVLLTLSGVGSAFSQKIASPRGTFYDRQATSTEAADSEGTFVEAPQTETIGSPKGTKAPGGDYGTGQPLCSPQISLSPKSNCTKGQHWWCDPCGFGGWGCGTPIRTFARNVKVQVTSLVPCGPWCRANGCNCSGQGPYAMDWSQPDRRSCPCDCKGSHYLFPWIWNYNPSRDGCCWNRWTQRGDGYRSGLQFNNEPSPEMPYENEAAPATEPAPTTPPAPAPVNTSKSFSGKMYKVSHDTKSIATRSIATSKKPASTKVRDVAPPTEVAETADEKSSPRRSAPTGAMSANYLARLVPKARDESEPGALTADKSGSSRRK
jgi:hypothetical protein